MLRLSFGSTKDVPVRLPVIFREEPGAELVLERDRNEIQFHLHGFPVQEDGAVL